jgi:peptidylprolyl isomerase
MILNLKLVANLPNKLDYMTRKIALLFAIVALMLTSCKDDYKNLKDGLYAEIVTPKGKILVALDYTTAPITVANFVSLAEGNNPFVMEDLKGKPFYDGLVFHRVEKDFVIQGGDPYGNGSGDPGYTFGDEITKLNHDEVGTLAMANSGPNTNGCQFYITLKPAPQLNGAYSVFGKVVQGMSVVKSIALNDEMTQVTIIRKGEDVKKFDAVKVFSDYFNKFNSVKAQKAAYFKEMKKSAFKTASGLAYKITQPSTGVKPTSGSVHINYSGFLEDGTLFDTSDPMVAKQMRKYDAQRAAQGGYTALPYTIGAKNMIPGFIEGIGYLKMGEKAILFIPAAIGYGAGGAGGVIPPNANLVFEIELQP